MKRSRTSDPPPDQPRYVSTAQAAEALGVSVTTVKRWVDDAIIPAHKTVGGHRKLLLADVLRLVRDERLPQADLSRLVPTATPTDPDELHARLAAAIEEDSLDLIRGIIHGGYRSGLSIETIGDRVLAPALHQVGLDWAAGRMSVMREHRITQACVSAVYELSELLRGHAKQHRPVALGGAPENDHTVLATLLAQLTLVDAGWEAVNIGPHTPVFAFESAIEKYSPILVWVSVTHLDDADKFLADFARLYEFTEQRKISVAVGGRALTEDVRSRMVYTSYGDRLTQFAAFARSLYRRPKLPKRGRPPHKTSGSSSTEGR